MRRLQTIKSQYSCFGKSMKDYNKYKSNMAHSRMDPYYDLEGQTAPIAFKSNRPNSAKKWFSILRLIVIRTEKTIQIGNGN